MSCKVANFMKLLSQMLYVWMDACNTLFASASNSRSFSQGHLTNRKKSFPRNAFTSRPTYCIKVLKNPRVGKNPCFNFTRREKIINELKETQLRTFARIATAHL